MKTALVLASLLLIATPAGAGTVDVTRAAAPDAKIEISVISGSVAVEGWDKSELRVTGTIGEAVSQLAIEGDTRRIEISVEMEEGRHRRGGEVNIEVRIPRGADLTVESVSAPVKIVGVSGRLAVQTVSGDQTIDALARLIEAESVSGAIGLALRDPLEALELETVSGDITVDGALARDAHVQISTVSGQVTLALPAATAADFDVSTFSGDIRNDFGPAAERASEYVPGKELSFATGGGGADVSVESFSGTVTLKKKP